MLVSYETWLWRWDIGGTGPGISALAVVITQELRLGEFRCCRGAWVRLRTSDLLISTYMSYAGGTLRPIMKIEFPPKKRTCRVEYSMRLSHTPKTKYAHALLQRHPQSASTAPVTTRARPIRATLQIHAFELRFCNPGRCVNDNLAGKATKRRSNHLYAWRATCGTSPAAECEDIDYGHEEVCVPWRISSHCPIEIANSCLHSR